MIGERFNRAARSESLQPSIWSLWIHKSLRYENRGKTALKQITRHAKSKVSSLTDNVCSVLPHSLCTHKFYPEKSYFIVFFFLIEKILCQYNSTVCSVSINSQKSAIRKQRQNGLIKKTCARYMKRKVSSQTENLVFRFAPLRAH